MILFCFSVSEKGESGCQLHFAFMIRFPYWSSWDFHYWNRRNLFTFVCILFFLFNFFFPQQPNSKKKIQVLPSKTSPEAFKRKSHFFVTPWTFAWQTLVNFSCTLMTRVPASQETCLVKGIHGLRSSRVSWSQEMQCHKENNLHESCKNKWAYWHLWAQVKLWGWVILFWFCAHLLGTIRAVLLFCLCNQESSFSSLGLPVGDWTQLWSPGSEHPCPDLAFSSRIALLMRACLSSIKINTFYKTQPSFKYSGSCLCQSPASLLLQVFSSDLKSS